MNVIQKIKAALIYKVIKLLSRSSYFTEMFFTKNRNLLVKENYEYAAVINTGYTHIERAVAIANGLGRTKNKLIIDAGAANGIISKMLSESFPDLQIYCFEPIHEIYLELKKNTSNNKNIVLFNKALGSKPGSSVIHILDRITSSSILEVSESIDDPYFAESLKERKTENITISTLDVEIPSDKNIAILKMDVQGFEMEVLKGGVNTLKRTDLIVLEMQNHLYYKNSPMYYELDKFLRELNFVCWDLIPSIRKNNKLMEWDAIYVSQRFIDETGS